MRKIGLFLGVTPHMGGAFQYSQTMLKAVTDLPKDKFDIIIYYTDDIWSKYIPPSIEKRLVNKHLVKYSYFLGATITLFCFPIILWRFLSIFIDPLSRKLKKENCDLWIFSSLSFSCYQMPVSAVGVIHDLMHRYEKFPENSSWLIYFWRERCFKRMTKWCKAIFVESETGKNQIVKVYKTDPLKILVFQLIPPNYIHSKSVPEDFDAVMDLPEKYLFYPAQFWEHKNHKRLIDAIYEVKKQCTDIKLVLVGSKKNAYDMITEQVQKLNLNDNIIFQGYVLDEYMPELYRRARAMIFPTFFGPTNIPPLEAMATECPMAISNIYAMPEQCKNTALYFDPKSVKDIAKCIEQLWVDDELCMELKKQSSILKGKYSQLILNKVLSDNLSIVLK